MNFAEQLVYWYLRLNGFFPITNFVLHHGAEHRTSDADLVAVRFPYVSEEIGGAPTDWDERFNDQWGIGLMTETVGLIVEVKSGGWNRNDLNDSTREWQVRDGLKRMGMISPEQLEDAVAELNRGPVTRVGGFTSGKLFVGNGRVPDDTTWLHLQLNDADQFVRRRMRTYRDRKFRDRLFFQGDLIQYLAWKGGRSDGGR
jgi:hypothetical protein